MRFTDLAWLEVLGSAADGLRTLRPQWRAPTHELHPWQALPAAAEEAEARAPLLLAMRVERYATHTAEFALGAYLGAVQNPAQCERADALVSARDASTFYGVFVQNWARHASCYLSQRVLFLGYVDRHWVMVDDTHCNLQRNEAWSCFMVEYSATCRADRDYQYEWLKIPREGQKVFFSFLFVIFSLAFFLLNARYFIF